MAIFNECESRFISVVYCADVARKNNGGVASLAFGYRYRGVETFSEHHNTVGISLSEDRSTLFQRKAGEWINPLKRGKKAVLKIRFGRATNYLEIKFTRTSGQIARMHRKVHVVWITEVQLRNFVFGDLGGSNHE